MKKNDSFILRRARIKDVTAIKNLINRYAAKGEMLPKSLNDLFEGLRNFWVVEIDGRIAGVCALQIAWKDLAEVKSLAVGPGYTGRGFGKLLVRKCLDEAREYGVKNVFSLTYKPVFFSRLGFRRIKREKLPHKVWNECIRCVKFPDCDENAMMLTLK